MLTTAHFTLADAPGTIAIFLLGFGAGLALVRGRIAWAPLTGLFAFGILGAIADAEAWSSGAALAIDVTALLLALACVVVVALELRRLDRPTGGDLRTPE